MANTCVVCGRETRIEEAEFELNVFIYRGGPNVGEIGISIVPDGMKQEKCFTNEGCGEAIYTMKAMKQMEEARDKVLKMPNLTDFLKEARNVANGKK